MSDNELWVIYATAAKTAVDEPGDHVAGLRAVASRAWDDCLDTIDVHELNTVQARSGNPYRAAFGVPAVPGGNK